MPMMAVVRDNNDATLFERSLLDASEMVSRDARYQIIDQMDQYGKFDLGAGLAAPMGRYTSEALDKYPTILPKNRANSRPDMRDGG